MPTYINVSCMYCNKKFNQTLKLYNLNLKRKCKNYCSIECSNKSHNKQKDVICEQCNITFKKCVAAIKNTKHNFCSSSCSCTYHNQHKTKGYRRSRLEIYLEKKLIPIYGEDFFKFNDSTTINSELDIYIPSLKLAFELNGIFHYEPIYGEEKLKYIKNNDNRKFQACIEKGISLCVIDSSSLKYFKEDNAIKYYNIISSIIQENLRSQDSHPEL